MTHGYYQLWPETFNWHPGSAIADAMDLARGGRFMTIPRQYPRGAWYSYNDRTCDYGCMVGEYFYWVLTSMLGAQDHPNRAQWISNEWRAYSLDRVKTMDPAAYAIFTNPSFSMPTVLPDGKYKGTPKQQYSGNCEINVQEEIEDEENSV